MQLGCPKRGRPVVTGGLLGKDSLQNSAVLVVRLGTEQHGKTTRMITRMIRIIILIILIILWIILFAFHPYRSEGIGTTEQTKK